MTICKETRMLFEKFPKQKLVLNPTPLCRMKRLEKEACHDSLWIKRDDMTGLAIGGNKARNLEYLLGDAIEKGCDTIIVTGPLQSNLCCQTGSAARKLGLDCIIIHNDDEPLELEGNTLLNHLLGIKTIYLGKKTEQEREKYASIVCSDMSKKGKKPYIIHSGGSTPLGVIGYIELAVELYEQCIQNNIDIKHVFVPAGNGGIAAGFIFGTSLLNRPFNVHVISVEYSYNELLRRIKNLINGLENLLGLKMNLKMDDFVHIYEKYRGDGWGSPTKKSVDIIFKLAELEGIFIEKVYTSKTLVGMLDIIKSGVIPKEEGVCFLHTGGLGSLFAQF